MTDLTRREMLGRTGVAALAAAGLAGCSSDGDGGDGGGSGDGSGGDGSDGADSGDGESSIPETAYTKWLAPPQQFSGMERYIFQTRQPRKLLSMKSALGDVTLRRYGQSPAAGIQWTDIEYYHRIPGGAVITGDLTFDEWQTSLEKQGFSKSETYGDYAIYTGETAGGIAFGDGTAVINQSREKSAETLKKIIDTRNGKLTRGPAADEDVGALVRALGDGPVVDGVTTPTAEGRIVEGGVALGQRFTLGNSESEYRVAVVFESESGVNVAPVVERLGSTELFDGTDALSTTIDGRTGIVSGTLPTGQISTFNPNLRGDGSDQPDAPQVMFAFDYDGDAGVLDITHEGGDTVEASKLYIVGSGFTDRDGVDMTGAGQWQGTSDDGQVRAGDGVTVGVTSAYNIVVGWGGTKTNVPLAEDSGPDA